MREVCPDKDGSHNFPESHFCASRKDSILRIRKAGTGKAGGKRGQTGRFPIPPLLNQLQADFAADGGCGFPKGTERYAVIVGVQKPVQSGTNNRGQTNRNNLE